MAEDTDFRRAFPDDNFFNRVRQRVHLERRMLPHVYDAEVDEVNKQVPDPVDYDKRNSMVSIIGAVISGLGAVTGLAQIAIDSESRSKSDFAVDYSLAARWSGLNYNDPLFSQEYVDGPLNSGTRSLFNSIHFHKTRQFGALGGNLARLKLAAECTDDLQVRAFVHARRMIDANALSLGEVARNSFGAIAWEDIPTDGRIFSTLVDYGSTVVMNTIETTNFDGFSDPRIPKVLDAWNRLPGTKPRDFSAGKLVELIGQVGAGVFTVIQAHYIGRLTTASDTIQQGKIRAEWVLTMADAATEAAAAASSKLPQGKGRQLREELAEDFLHSLCRPAFHAFRAGDKDRYTWIRDAYFAGRASKLRDPFVEQASRRIQAAMPPGAQWLSLLDVASALKWGSSDASARRVAAADRFIKFLDRKPATGNTTIAQAALALDQRLKRSGDPRNVAWRWGKSAGVSMHRPYYDTIASA